MPIIFFLLINLIIAVLIITRVNTFIRRRKEQIELFSPGIIFSVFYFGYYVLGASFSIFLIGRNYFSSDVVEFFPISSLISFIGITFFYLGYGLPRSTSHIYLQRDFFSEAFQDSYRITIFLFLLTWILRFYLISKGIVVSKLFIVANNEGIDPNEFYLAQLTTIDRIFWIVNPGIGIFASLLAYKDALQGKRSKIDRILYIFIGIEIMYQLFVLNNRLPALLLLIYSIPFAVYYKREKLIKIRYILIALVLWIFVVYPLGQYMRTAAYEYLRYGFTFDNIFENFLPDVIRSYFDEHESSNSYVFKDDKYVYYRFAPNDFLGNILERIHSEDYKYMYGESYVIELPMLIPRILYPGKPEFNTQAEGVIENHYNLPFVDTMTTPMTEAYSNFGVLGVAVVMFLYGYASNKYWKYFYKNRRDKMLFTIYLYYLYDFYSPEQSLVGGLMMGIRSILSLLIIMLLIDKFIFSFFVRKSLKLSNKLVIRELK